MSNIGTLLRTYRENERYGIRSMAKAIGISPATLSRIERGFPCDQRVMLLLINWLFALSSLTRENENE